MKNQDLIEKIVAKSNINIIVFGLILLLILGTFISCEKTTEYVCCPDTTSINGRYEFTLVPGISFQDTTLIKGKRGTDFPEYSATYDDVYMYEDGEGNVIGNSKTWKISGSRSGQDLTLDLYVHPQGPINIEIPVDSMYKFSTMNLIINEYGNLEGDGIYYTYEYYPELEDETYTLFANKISGLSFKEGEGNYRFNFCDIVSSISSFLISTLTDGVFRPIGNCYLHKDGGGYYIFGHEGPGSIFPVYTQTIYLPWEFSWCKVRKYGFDIDIKGEAIGYEALKDKLELLDNVLKHFFEKLGFPSLDLLFDAMDDFHQQFGGFAFSTAYDSHTHNLSIYVNHKQGSSEDAKNHLLTQTLKAAFEPYVSSVYVYAGSNIYDSWHLRRSDIGVCNSTLVIMYLFGTHNVNYD
jgi:hypothetical protein